MPLNAAALLAVWETATGQSLTQWVLHLLAHARPERSAETWAGMSVGQRDAGLLSVREELFGSRFEATAVCPQCGERVEAGFAIDDVWVGAPADLGASLRFSLDGYRIECRPVTSLDLLEAASADTHGRETLLRRCVRVVYPSGIDADPVSLPASAIQTALREMAAADPQADVQVELACPSCAHRWSIPFDIVSYLWSEVDDLAQQLLREVHALALAYGWHESDILAMSARRRHHYLEMVGG